MQQDIRFAGQFDALAILVDEAITVVGQLCEEYILYSCGGHIPGVDDIHLETLPGCQAWPATALGGQVECPFLRFLTGEIDEIMIRPCTGSLIIPALIGQTDGVGQ